MFRTIPSRYAQARLLPTLSLRPSGFLYNSRNAESYSLNPVAATLVAALLRGVAVDELWRELPPRFDVSEPQAHCDTLRFLSALHHLGLLVLPKAEQAATPQDEQAKPASQTKHLESEDHP